MQNSSKPSPNVDYYQGDNNLQCQGVASKNRMDISFPASSYIKKVSFEFATPESIRRLSVRQITTSQVFDSLGNPVHGGLYDPALGPVDKNARCPTCGQSAFQCPGHFGHIELAVPVYAPMVFSSMFQLLKQSCLYCHRLRASRVKTALIGAKLRLLQGGLLLETTGLDAWLSNHVTRGMHNDADMETVDEAGIVEHVVQLDESAIIDRLNRHVKQLIAKKRAGQRIVERKSAALQAQRQAIIDEFLKKVPSSSQCPHCKAQVHGLYRHANVKIFLTPSRRHQSHLAASETLESQMKYLSPIHVFEHLKKIWENEHQLLELLYSSSNTRNRPDFRLFFAQVIAVTPCRFRPPTVYGESQFDHPQNMYLSEILKLNQRIIDLRMEPKSMINDGGVGDDDDDGKGAVSDDPKFEQLVQTWISLQEQVNYFFDSSHNTQASGRAAPAGIKQLLEKKEGLFRKHMMGKRVNFAARSVISPDAMIETSEIGVPLVFAKRLTFPEPVTRFNVEGLKQAVMNGPDTYPGASHVEMEDGSLVSLEVLNVDARRSLAEQLLTPSIKREFSANNKKVFRHICDGDSVIMNRQPTLHKPSMMAHRVKVLSGEKTLRMHYANCNTYNADFDGDEMNLHFPQNQLARAEALCITNTNRQYLGSTDGSPLRGLIQDHISTGVIMSLKDTFFDRETFQQLLFGSLPTTTTTSSTSTNNTVSLIQTPQPAIFAPRRLWTGKQLVSSVLQNLTQGRPQLNLQSSCRTPAAKLLRGHPEEAQVVVVNGSILTGILDKSQFGTGAYGITHAVYELYGPDCAGQLLTAMGRLLTCYDQMFGFTCRMDDIMLRPEAEDRRRALIEASQAVGRQVVSNLCKTDDDNGMALRSAFEQFSRSDEQLKALDGAMKTRMNDCTSRVIEACLPEGQLVAFPRNNMALMTQSGAKGSMVNFSQISGLLGQQELEGRRVPMMVSGRTLPSFRPWDTRPRAGGYITQRFLTGIRPQEFFFHCMAGREGLIDTAVKTSRSGYLQRCLIKHLESLRVHYDHTVRDDDGTIVQFRYGEDGLDVTKQKYLGRLAFAAANFSAVVAGNPPEVLDRIDTEVARRAGKRALRNPERHDPILTLFSPSAHLGVVGERFARQLEEYISKELPEDLDAKQFRALMWLKWMRSLADPGEAVGLLAAQSIGEPSTQMTLNTFHFAGFGAKNVTLGIPRLREIIMTASQKIKTPMMTVAVAPGVDAQHIASLLSRVTAKQLITRVEVAERLDSRSAWRSIIGADRARIYSIRIRLDPKQTPMGIDSSDIQATFEHGFMVKLMAAVDRALKRTGKAAVAKADELVQAIAETRTWSSQAIAAPTGGEDGGDDGEPAETAQGRRRKDFDEEDDVEGDAGEMDASDAKAASRRKQAATYEEDEEDKEQPPTRSDSEGEEQPEHRDAEEGEEEAVDGQHPSATTIRYTKLAEFGNVRDFSFTPDLVSFSLCYAARVPKLLMLEIIERTIAETVIRQVPHVSRAFASPASPPATQVATVSTEGVNVRGLWEWACCNDGDTCSLELDTLTSNDIGAILHCYGVEAARATIVSEIAGVFGVYGISVDARHLSLIADYMTLDGGYRPFNRTGIAHSVSPLLKMSFETTVGFLKQAVLSGDYDELETPAARLVLGQPVHLGTGSFEVMQRLVT